MHGDAQWRQTQHTDIDKLIKDTTNDVSTAGLHEGQVVGVASQSDDTAQYKRC